ncbi:MAG: cupin domain-containing protein [Myxococcaceae bacterium]|nr:cupin domain-containing protein [Myxococcaceae bacterium]MCI0673339.1 cupin domain-containing protein [Myxococcaceae bacterium]
MNASRRKAVAAAVVASLAVAGGVAAQATKPRATQPVLVNADTAKFKQVIPGISKVVLQGDPDKGPYATFTRFVPGQKNALHTHSSDIRQVVLEGAYLYEADGRKVRVGPKSFFVVPAGTPHTSGGDPKEGALFYEESSGPFDIQFIKSPEGGPR